MGKETYITQEEREKCRKVADAFGELYEMTDIVVVDAGKYGFAKLQYYKLPRGFDIIMTFRDSELLFNDLWEEWFYEQLLTPALGTPISELDYEDIFKCLPKEKQEELMTKRDYFKEMSRQGLSGEGNLQNEIF